MGGSSAGSNSGSNVPILWGCNKNHYRRHHGYFSHGPSRQRHTKLPLIDITEHHRRVQEPRQRQVAVFVPRGGSAYGTNNNVSSSSLSSSPLVRIIGTITQLLISMGKFVLPTIVVSIKTIVTFYNSLPMDAITAQIGLVYCFLGGYYPTLFSSLQAAKYCGWSIMVSAVTDLTNEAIKVIDEIDEQQTRSDIFYNRKDLFLQQTNIVLKTVDPMKINQAAGALYTTWLGVSTVLRQEYARVINLSLTLASGIERISYFILQVPLNIITPKDYQKWVPAIIGWISKGIAMRLAWRIERILTASTSAIAGGAMFASSIIRMFNNSNKFKRLFKNIPRQRPSLVENMLGITVGGVGFYTQIEHQYKNNFSFEIPFPLSLVTWPFDLAERWIQWYITKY
ncbi:hypothetical protein FRACYDRAFT_195507 [Fragilariopsis cylindrus CCMP1102]|uniref:Uncharacterized protein n=1 Tax=Fragilariopsis cylindrus CCMP1102 TaxID=635003 RepID=A0A1E7ETP8_9STRA|nr:hypothetical protein FRACYDRAFT_195507 [Fragilariopsis cylindrus CCMP1102]|eukprot:OEU09205.1 hypothetical protein FRACYDRAFT_195507 [Fragilariopsis cylindrus CCMP1102]